MNIKNVLILAAGLGVGFSFVLTNSSPQRKMLTQNDIPRHPQEVGVVDQAKQAVADNDKLSDNALSADLSATGLFDDLPPKLTREEVETAKTLKSYTTILCSKRGFILVNSPRNRALVKIAVDLNTKITFNGGEVKVVTLSDTIPISFYDFIY